MTCLLYFLSTKLTKYFTFRVSDILVEVKVINAIIASRAVQR